MMKKIILIGAGGHAKSCIDVIESGKKFKIICLIDKNIKDKKIYNYPIYSEDIDHNLLLKKTKNILISVGHIKNGNIRERLFKKYKKLGFKFPIIISPNSHISKYAKIKEGTIIMHQSIVNSSSVIGINCIINNKSLIEHDVTIGDHCHISTSATVNGNVNVGNKVFIGSNSVVVNSVNIKSNSFIPSMTLIK